MVEHTLPSSTKRMELSIQLLAVESKPLTQKTKNLKGHEKLIATVHICNSWAWEANGRAAWSWGKPALGSGLQHGGGGGMKTSWVLVFCCLGSTSLGSEVQSWRNHRSTDPHCNVYLGRNELFLLFFFFFFCFQKGNFKHIAQGQNGCPSASRLWVWSGSGFDLERQRGENPIRLLFIKKFQKWDFK